MKKDIILSGVGGQGILSIATVIGKAALKEGLYMKQAEVHGMSQRGGDVQSNLRISDKPIASDLIPSGKCDLIISLEPMEGLRYLPYLSSEGWLVTNETPFVNIPNYPEEDKVMAYLLLFLRANVWIHSLRGMMTDTPLYSISSRMICLISSWFFFNGTTTRIWAGSTPRPIQMDSMRPVPAESWPPVIAVVSLSEMTITTLAFSLTQSSKPVIPECVKVESPITATDG